MIVSWMCRPFPSLYSIEPRTHVISRKSARFSLSFVYTLSLNYDSPSSPSHCMVLNKNSLHVKAHVSRCRKNILKYSIKEYGEAQRRPPRTYRDGSFEWCRTIERVRRQPNDHRLLRSPMTPESAQRRAWSFFLF